MDLNWRRVAFWFGVLALVDAALLALPVSLPDALLTQVVPRAVVPLLALVAAGYGVSVLATAAGEPPRRDPPATLASDDDWAVDRVGSDLDAAFDALGSGAESPWSRENAARTIRAELRRTAVAALTSRGHPREEAERLLDAGAWTDDERAAAFLGDPHLPLRTRVRDWASGEGQRRRAEAAAAALAALTDPVDAGDDAVPGRASHRPAGDLFGATGDPATAEDTADLTRTAAEQAVDPDAAPAAEPEGAPVAEPDPGPAAEPEVEP